MNIFADKFQCFIQSDARINRKNLIAGYTVTEHQTFVKHRTFLPSSILKDKRVLDLGCCVGATGAWVLHHGAKSYTGVEFQQNLADKAASNLDHFFHKDLWEILVGDIESFVKTCKNFDIVVVFGALHTVSEYQQFVKNLTRISDFIVVESAVPNVLGTKPLSKLKNGHLLQVVEYMDYGIINHESGVSMRCATTAPSVTALATDFNRYGFTCDLKINDSLQQHLPEVFQNHSRFGLIAVKSSLNVLPSNFVDSYSAELSNAIPWGSNDIDSDLLNNFTSPARKIENIDTAHKKKEWVFDTTVAGGFVDHALKHIPDYLKVIDLGISIASKYKSKESKIIDVGCATGETLERLKANGFENLYGVDSSLPMIEQCQPNLATLIHSDEFPKDHGNFEVIFFNWTLHFINDKTRYLVDVFDKLDCGGFLILTDKTCNEGLDLQLYHDFKRSKGVSDDVIRAKAESLKGVMFVDSPEWYLNTLKHLGFSKVSIINAAPCFTTFLAVK